MDTLIDDAPPITRIRLERVRISYPRLFVPAQFQGEGPAKFSATFLIDPRTQRELLRDATAACEAAAAVLWPKGEWKQKKALNNPKAFWWPIRSGDEKAEKRGYGGMVFIGANTQNRPGVVDRDVIPVVDQDAVYPGMYVNATVQFRAYSKPNWGVGCYLQNVQLLGGGERLGGKPDPADDFEPVQPPDEEDEFLK